MEAFEAVVLIAVAVIAAALGLSLLWPRISSSLSVTAPPNARVGLIEYSYNASSSTLMLVLVNQQETPLTLLRIEAYKGTRLLASIEPRTTLPPYMSYRAVLVGCSEKPDKAKVTIIENEKKTTATLTLS